MRILLHAEHYFPTETATAKRMKVFADAFRNMGHEVIISVPTTGTTKNCRLPEQLCCCPAISIGNKSTLRRMLNNLSFAITSVLYMGQYGHIDVVITSSPPPLISLSGWIIAKCKDAKVVYDIRDLWPDVALEMGSFSEKSIYAYVFRWICNFMVKYSDMISCVSPGIAKALGERYPQQNHKIQLVNNGFDETLLQVPENKELVSRYELDTCMTCVYVGNVGKAQGLDKMLYLASLPENRSIRFLIFGKGMEKDLLEKQANDMELNNVQFCGTVTHQEAAVIQKHATVCFVSLKNSKMRSSVPTKLYEALGLGCPVLLAAAGDSCDILNRTAFGRCAHPEDNKALAKAFAEILKERTNILERKSDTQMYIKENYSRQSISCRFAMLLQDLIREKTKEASK